jgi:hypothetical protein
MEPTTRNPVFLMPANDCTLHGDLYQVPVPRTHWATTGYRCSHGDLLYLQYIHPGDRYQVLVFTAISFTLSRMSPWGSGCTICTYHIVIPAIPQAPSVRGDERVARGAAMIPFVSALTREYQYCTVPVFVKTSPHRRISNFADDDEGCDVPARASPRTLAC